MEMSKNPAIVYERVSNMKQAMETSEGLAIVYDRASSKKQEENYTRQDVKRIGFEIAKRFGYATEPEPRVEIQSGEDLKNRSVMLGVLDDIERHKLINGKCIKAIIVPNFTRLSRDEDIIDGMIIRKTCRDNGVVVIDFNGKQYDFTKDNDQDTALIEFWFAARDKRQMLSNTMRGKKEKVLQGDFLSGGPQIGYDIVPSGKINHKGVPLKKKVINLEEAKLVRRICRMYKEDSANHIASALNKQGILRPVKYPTNLKISKGEYRPWTANDIMRIVSNPIYAGWKHWAPRTNKKTGEVSRFLRDFEPQMHFDSSLQIISQQEFDRLQQIRKERKKVPSRAANSELPFSYILKCPICSGPIGGNIRYREKGKRIYLQHSYRCRTHYENPVACPNGYRISFIPVASAVIPFVAELIKNQLQLAELLDQAAKEFSTSDMLDKLEKETRAELDKTHQAIKRVTDSIANDVLTQAEAKEKLQELREKKDRLLRDVQGFEEKKTIREDILQAIGYLNGDLEKSLWKLAEEKPKVLGRILRLIFQPRSVAIEPLWDSKQIIPIKTSSKRRGRITEFELEESFDKGVVTQRALPRAASSHPRVDRSSARQSRPCARLESISRGTIRPRGTARPRAARANLCPYRVRSKRCCTPRRFFSRRRRTIRKNRRAGKKRACREIVF
jgi:DNA invertase Pin-like site-specific DNA recombinase